MVSRACSLVVILTGLLLATGCGGGAPADQPIVASISPSVAAAGEEIILYGAGFDHGEVPTVSFDGLDFVHVVSYTNNRIHVVIPAGSVSGSLYVAAGIGQSDPFPFTVGTRVTVPEVEPNDAADGSDATAATTNRVVTGKLKDTSDVDTFTFTGLAGTHYRLKLSPNLPNGVLKVNGSVVFLDSNAEADLSANSAKETLTLSNSTGDYTITLTAID
ncbi:MAG: hypothetical protein JSS65_13075 [Armatimonadetes bacterium]|nr:hypothetical protein [Armatimonadota bacterium]